MGSGEALAQIVDLVPHNRALGVRFVSRDPRRRPTTDGAIVYLRAKGGIDGCIERATRAGGKVVLPKTGIGDPGYIAIVADTEGNHVGLHMERS